MIALTVNLAVDGKSKSIQIDSLTPGDFASGPAHLMIDYLEPIAEILMDAYAELSSETGRAAMDMLEERQSISKRLARLGMV